MIKGLGLIRTYGCLNLFPYFSFIIFHYVDLKGYAGNFIFHSIFNTLFFEEISIAPIFDNFQTRTFSQSKLNLKSQTKAT